jgi:hypothetical protein
VLPVLAAFGLGADGDCFELHQMTDFTSSLLARRVGLRIGRMGRVKTDFF